MFAMTTAERWRPNRSLIAVFVALCIFLLALISAVASLRAPPFLGYSVAPGAGAHLWRITTVWPSSFAWDAGLRPGMVLHGRGTPATQGATTVYVWAARCCRALLLPPRGVVVASLIWLELTLAAVVLVIGAGSALFARARIPALLLLLACVVLAVGLCGVAAFTHAGVPWGSVLFDVCWFALLPPLTLVLATVLPPGGRTLALGWRVLVLMGGIILTIQIVGFIVLPLYTLTRDVEGALFVLVQALASGIWLWRAWGARGTPQWPEYRLVLLGIGGSFGGFALLAVLPAMLRWAPPWPLEAGGVVLVLFPASLSWALLRLRLLQLRRTVQRTAITVILLSSALVLGLLCAADGLIVAGVSLAVLLAGVGVPLVQRVADRLLPDSQATYAALVERSGEQLNLAVELEELGLILDTMRRGLGVAGLCLRRGDQVLAQAGVCLPAYTRHLVVRHEMDALARLEVGEKLHHDELLAADLDVLTMFCHQLGAFLAGRHLTLQLRETVNQLQETQRRLLTARRRERERLGQSLHQGPLQEVLLLSKMLRPGSVEAVAALQVEASLRAILTETASALLRDFGLPAALRSYIAYLTPYATEQGCTLVMTVDETIAALADDESFVLYQLAHEALANALRHCGGGQVSVNVQMDGGQVALEVRDDGCGLPEGWKWARVDHRGLPDALELVQAVSGATATAATGTEGGTIVCAQIPWRGRAGGEHVMKGTDMISIVIAEDHAVVREGLRRLLSEDERLAVVAEARTGYEILGLVLQHQPDILLLDLDLPGQNGLAALQAVQAHVRHPPRTLILSAFRDEEYVRRAHELGVGGFLSKSCDGGQLRQAIYRVMAGGSAFDPAIAAIVKEQRYSERGRFQFYTDGSEALTAAELNVLCKMLEGQSYEDIGAELGRTCGTVRIQATTIFQKLGVNSRGQAVRKALQLGILHLTDE